MGLTERAGQFVTRLADQPYFYKLFGLRKEFPELNPFSTGLMVLGSLLHTWKHHSIIEGYPLPRKGAAILTGNHCSEADAYLACLAGRRAGRVIRTVIKKSLIVQGAYEQDAYLKSIGDKKNPLDYNALNAFVMRGVGVIPILRDDPASNIATLRSSYQVLNSDQVLGLFIQPSRDEEGLLRNLQKGVAHIASKYGDTPIHLMAFSEERVTLLKPFTYNQVRNNYFGDNEFGQDITLPEFTIYLADRLAGALPKHVQDDWKTRKDSELARLKAA